ncbi:MAG: DUF2080 family transposase-associated protein [Desulfobacteraceae bacterium]|nr:MAG: DUF2080 family transposase-associated protein [Desulfobacteraceae bacterium]
MADKKKYDEQPVHQQEITKENMPPIKRLKVKFECYGTAIIEKSVKSSGNTGRVYLPPDWVGKKVKVIRIN